MQKLFVLTGKADGGTQDVLGFYSNKTKNDAWTDAILFIDQHKGSRRSIIRLEVYNPRGKAPKKPIPNSKSPSRQADSVYTESKPPLANALN